MSSVDVVDVLRFALFVRDSLERRVFTEERKADGKSCPRTRLLLICSVKRFILKNSVRIMPLGRLLGYQFLKRPACLFSRFSRCVGVVKDV